MPLRVYRLWELFDELRKCWDFIYECIYFNSLFFVFEEALYTLILISFYGDQDIYWGCPCGEMVKTMDYGIVVREFVLLSRYYVHFQPNTLGKGMNPLILPAMG